LVGRPEGKRPLGRSRLRWKDNIKMDVLDLVWECVDLIHLVKGPVVSSCKHGNEPSGFIKYGILLN
jgi:hypothetical protein